MRKTEVHKRDLNLLFMKILGDGDWDRIITYLSSNSSLPGRRANLELAEAFAEEVDVFFKTNPREVWDLCVRLASIPCKEAPTNNPREFLSFCGVYALGDLGSGDPKLYEEALSRLKDAAHDPRWRMREAVVLGIQRLLEKEGEQTLRKLEDWIENEKWLAMRAVAAGVAEPEFLQTNPSASKALNFHERIMEKMLTAQDRKSDAFRTLRKGLGYTLSVVTKAFPKEGF